MFQVQRNFVRGVVLGTMIALGVPLMSLQAADLLQVNNSSGWQIYPGGGYRYGPSIIINSDNSIDMWLSAPGTKPAWPAWSMMSGHGGGTEIGFRGRQDRL